MATVAKQLSQGTGHTGIGFPIVPALTGSIVLGGLAVLIEPVLNALLVALSRKDVGRLAGPGGFG